MIWWQFSSGRFVPREHTSKPLTHPATFHCIVLLQKCNIYYFYFVAVCHKQQKHIFATVQFQPTNQRWAIRQKVRRWRQNSFFFSRVCIQFLPSITFSQCFKRSSVPGQPMREVNPARSAPPSLPEPRLGRAANRRSATGSGKEHRYFFSSRLATCNCFQKDSREWYVWDIKVI